MEFLYQYIPNLDIVLPFIWVVETKDIVDDNTKIKNNILNVINLYGALVSNNLNVPQDIFEKTLFENQLFGRYLRVLVQ